MTVITRTQLTELAKRVDIAKVLVESRSASRTSVFLSHSHLDDTLVRYVVAVLSGQGVSVYVDWLDTGLPEKTTIETAHRIREKINENERFLLLSTDRSAASRWVPWELGYADGVGKGDRIAILPVADTSGSYPGNEYLGLYPRITVSTSGALAVFGPGKDRGDTLSSWLQT